MKIINLKKYFPGGVKIKYKKIILTTLFLLFILMIGTVSAKGDSNDTLAACFMESSVKSEPKLVSLLLLVALTAPIIKINSKNNVVKIIFLYFILTQPVGVF